MTTSTAILAGGQSRRMGTDKAALKRAGVSLLQHTAQIAKSAGGRVLVIGRLRPGNWPGDDIEFFPDIVPGLGPLGGLQTALENAQAPVLALACDLPLLTCEAVQWLQRQHGRCGRHGLVVVNYGQWEPLFTLYTPSCLPLISARLAENKCSLHGLIEAGEFEFVPAPEWVAKQLVNVNTPQEWGTLIAQKWV